MLIVKFFVTAIPVPSQPPDPCNPSPCGENAQCSVHNGVARCTCIPPYKGNPHVSCRPECVINSDCPSHLACVAQNCRDPCQGICGINAECNVVNHIPVCSCLQGFSGNPFQSCREQPKQRKYCFFIEQLHEPLSYYLSFFMHKFMRVDQKVIHNNFFALVLRLGC